MESIPERLDAIYACQARVSNATIETDSAYP